MALSIATNSASINSQRILSSSQSALNKSMERLTSSMRINRAADDAAGLAITTKQTAQIRSLNQAVRNANDGISMIQTAESGMDAVQNMLTRMKELATQGATDTLSTSERDYLAMEINELRQEINNVANRTTFNGIQLLNGSTSSLGSNSQTVIDNSSTVKVGTSIGDTSFEKIDVRNAISAGGASPGQGTFEFSQESADIDGDGVDDNVLRLTSSTGQVQNINLNDIEDDVYNTGSTITFNFDQLGVSVTLKSLKDGTTVDDMATDIDGEVIITTGPVAPVLKKGEDDTYQVGSAVTSDGATIVTKASISAIDVSASSFSDSGTSNTYKFVDSSEATADTLTLVDVNGNTEVLNISAIKTNELNTGDTYTFDFSKLGISITVQATSDGVTIGDIAAEFQGAAAATMSIQTEAGLVPGGVSGGGSGDSLVIQAGTYSTAENQISLKFGDIRTSSLGNLDSLINALASGTRESYESLMDEAEVALDAVSTARGTLGAQMNRLEYTIQGLESMAQNMSDARMRIRDADFAAETASLSKNQIMQQAGIAMLAQANAMPQNVLSLLR